jgi:hypothetical protein
MPVKPLMPSARIIDFADLTCISVTLKDFQSNVIPIKIIVIPSSKFFVAFFRTISSVRAPRMIYATYIPT